MKLKCDHCGKIIEAGLISCINHNADDCLREEISLGPGMVGVYVPYMSFTPVDEKEEQLVSITESK